ncbi:MAG: ale [Rubritepida sp.]|nr:ale [Rubritepida sp.]
MRRMVGSFRSHPAMIAEARERLLEAGFEVLQTTQLTINIGGTPDTFERALRTKIVEREFPTVNGPTTTHLDSPDTELAGLISTFGTPLGRAVEGIALEVPRRLFQPDPNPPRPDYWHLRPPEDLVNHCNARIAHVMGITGQGVRVAMVDSGWYAHPYFAARGYAVAPVTLGPAASDPEHDESGHGTGESANILALAPECQLLPVKMNFVNTIGAFNVAVAMQPDIITCSWGSHTPFALTAADFALAASISAAVASGITVIFSAGNGHAGFPGQHPEVISAGGAFLDADGSVQASSYSSGFMSPVYPDRSVPDLCGLVGMRPKAVYIMLPVEPGDQIDTGNSGGVFPDGDETAPDDGWAGFSGTSAAAPQLAGAAALLKHAFPDITPDGVKAALVGGARDVTAGSCSPVPQLHDGLPAEPGIDVATGSGLVDAMAALGIAYVSATTEPVAVAADAPLLQSAYLRGIADGVAILAISGGAWDA